MTHVVLLEPEIPSNTGNIARTCVAVGAKLHLIEPLGFSLEDKYLKRAGMDYWESLSLEIHTSFLAFSQQYPHANCYYATTKAAYIYSEIQYEDDVFLFFGKETQGLPESLLRKNKERCIRIPMIEANRSLNLSNSVAIILYEMMRQKGFSTLQKTGFLKEGPNG